MYIHTYQIRILDILVIITANEEETRSRRAANNKQTHLLQIAFVLIPKLIMHMAVIQGCRRLITLTTPLSALCLNIIY